MEFFGELSGYLNTLVFLDMRLLMVAVSKKRNKQLNKYVRYAVQKLISRQHYSNSNIFPIKNTSTQGV